MWRAAALGPGVPQDWGAELGQAGEGGKEVVRDRGPRQQGQGSEGREEVAPWQVGAELAVGRGE